MSSNDSQIELNRTYEGNALEFVRRVQGHPFDLTVTSPPYFRLREYSGNPAEIGREKTPQEFIDKLVTLFMAIAEKTTPSGSIWVNIDDSYDRGPMLITDRFVVAMSDAGLHCVNKVVWVKPDPQAESVGKRFSRKYEMFYWFVKSWDDFYWNPEASKMPVRQSTVKRMEYKFNVNKGTAVARMRGQLGDMSHKIDEILERGVDCGDAWILHTNKDRVDHIAPYPQHLILRPIVGCCPDNGIIFDPFMGSGTTGLVAKKLGRRFLGIDLNPASVTEANERCGSEQIGLFDSPPGHIMLAAPSAAPKAPSPMPPKTAPMKEIDEDLYDKEVEQIPLF